MGQVTMKERFDSENLPQTNENQTKDKEEYEVVEIENFTGKNYLS